MTNRNDIHIEYLCNEPFWKFAKIGENQFCKVCRHQIKDFSNLSKKSAIDTIRLTGGEACGLFYKDQFIIDNNTQNGKSLKNIILASSLSTLVAFNSNAQNIKKDSTKIEQQADSLINSKNYVNQDTTQECLPYIKNEQLNDSTSLKKKPRRIGQIVILFNGRFPFIHIRKIRRGKMRYSRPFE